MNLEIRQEALQEVEAAFLYYENQVRGIGSKFLNALEEGYKLILSNPKAWTVIEHGHPPLHRCLLRRFPYGLIYMLDEKKLIVVAVMHLARKPGYWKKRANPRKKRRLDS